MALDEFGDEIGYDTSAKMWGKLKGEDWTCEHVTKKKTKKELIKFGFKEGEAQRLRNFIIHRLLEDDDAINDQSAGKRDITFEEAKEWLLHNSPEGCGALAALDAASSLKLAPKGANRNTPSVVTNPAYAGKDAVPKGDDGTKEMPLGTELEDLVVKTAKAGMQSCPDCWDKKGHFGTKIFKHDYSKISKSIASSDHSPRAVLNN